MAREAELAMDERFRPRGVQRNSKTAVAAARDAERALAAAEAAVVTATRNKAARDRVKARAGGAGAENRRRRRGFGFAPWGGEVAGSNPVVAFAFAASGPVLGEADAPYRGSFAVAGAVPEPRTGRPRARAGHREGVQAEQEREGSRVQ